MKKLKIVRCEKKSAQEKCTRVHKWITGRPLTHLYTLVNFCNRRALYEKTW